MGKINWSRVALGGLAAGLLLNCGEFILHGLLFNTEWKAAIAALGKTLDTGVRAWATISATNLITGIFATWLYAAIRPRYGPGPRTAVRAAFAVWLIGWLLPVIASTPMGIFPARLLMVMVTAGLLELILVTLLGAWFYKEA